MNKNQIDPNKPNHPVLGWRDFGRRLRQIIDRLDSQSAMPTDSDSKWEPVWEKVATAADELRKRRDENGNKSTDD